MYDLQEFYARDLRKLREEINLYPDEKLLWETRPGIANSAGNLCLHLLGNLNHFIGATLGHTGYVRQRDLEFSTRDVPRVQLNAQIDALLPVIDQVFEQLTATDYDQSYPLEKNGRTVSTGHMLLHLLAHLSYHLGQVNYHRRLLAGG